MKNKKSTPGSETTTAKGCQLDKLVSHADIPNESIKPPKYDLVQEGFGSGGLEFIPIIVFFIIILWVIIEHG